MILVHTSFLGNLYYVTHLGDVIIHGIITGRLTFHVITLAPGEECEDNNRRSSQTIYLIDLIYVQRKYYTRGSIVLDDPDRSVYGLINLYWLLGLNL